MNISVHSSKAKTFSHQSHGGHSAILVVFTRIFHVYFVNCGSTPQANHNFPDFSVTKCQILWLFQVFQMSGHPAWKTKPVLKHVTISHVHITFDTSSVLAHRKLTASSTQILYCNHRLRKLRTDGGQSRVHELGSIDFVLWLMIVV